VSSEPISLFDYESLAESVMPRRAWDYVAGGVLDEITVARNRSAFEALTLRTRLLRDVSVRDLSTTLLGTEISLPVLLSPAGAQTLAHPSAELATARGAGASRTLMVAAVRADHTLEEIAGAATGPLWFQLKYFGDAITEDLVRRAEGAGYTALVLTVDSVGNLSKERDVRNRFVDPGAEGMGLANLRVTADRVVDVGDPSAPGWDLEHTPTLTWSVVAWLRGVTSLPLVLKGITTAEDALLAVEHGVDAIIVSNHGGRVLDTMPASIESLPEVVDAVQGRAEVYLDSGVRRGSDVLKALALGARAVGIGRPVFWGLAVNGADGVRHVVEILRAELDGALACCGQTSVRSLEPNVVGRAAPSPGHSVRRPPG
jgi:isopentenyl diphosphate isomerase/L-lactate dehydrogenase-like FMN-dependent dehydrogenase